MVDKSIKEKNPDLYSQMIDLVKNEELNQLYFYPDREKFSKIEDISFDKAFVESNTDNYVANLDAGWTDLGSWHSLSNLQKNPEHGLTFTLKANYPRTEKALGLFRSIIRKEFSKVKILSINPNHKIIYANA